LSNFVWNPFKNIVRTRTRTIDFLELLGRGRDPAMCLREPLASTRQKFQSIHICYCSNLLLLVPHRCDWLGDVSRTYSIAPRKCIQSFLLFKVTCQCFFEPGIKGHWISQPFAFFKTYLYNRRQLARCLLDGIIVRDVIPTPDLRIGTGSPDRPDPRRALIGGACR
jgi:hypothetical protein